MFNQIKTTLRQLQDHQSISRKINQFQQILAISEDKAFEPI